MSIKVLSYGEDRNSRHRLAKSQARRPHAVELSSPKPNSPSYPLTLRLVILPLLIRTVRKHRPNALQRPMLSRTRLARMHLVPGCILLRVLLSAQRPQRHAGLELSRKTPPRSYSVSLFLLRNTH